MGLCHGPVCWGIGTIVSLVLSLVFLLFLLWCCFIVYRRVKQRQREAVARGDVEAGIWIPIPRALYVSPPPRAYRAASPQPRIGTNSKRKSGGGRTSGGARVKR